MVMELVVVVVMMVAMHRLQLRCCVVYAGCCCCCCCGIAVVGGIHRLKMICITDNGMNSQGNDLGKPVYRGYREK